MHGIIYSRGTGRALYDIEGPKDLILDFMQDGQGLFAIAPGVELLRFATVLATHIEHRSGPRVFDNRKIIIYSVCKDEDV